MPRQDLHGKVALITGASSGIGRAVAHRLEGLGVKLALASRRADDLGIEGALAQSVDVRDPAQLDSLVAAAKDRFGGVDILIANAGVGHYGQFLDVPPERAQEMVETNCLGTINAVRSVLPALLERSSGDIVAIASEAGRRGLPGEAAYSASKFGQVGFIRAMDNELRPQGIRAMNICPGGVATEFAVGDGRGRVKGSAQLDQMMNAEDIADVTEFALTRPAHYRLLEVALRPMSEDSWG